MLKHWLVDRCEQEEDQKPLDLSISTKPVIDNTTEQRMLSERHHLLSLDNKYELTFCFEAGVCKIVGFGFRLAHLKLGFLGKMSAGELSVKSTNVGLT